MLTLYKFIPAWGMSDMSPFCIKLETYFRMTNLAYDSQLGNMKKAPKGKLPYIDHNGNLLADSTAIVNHFEALATKPLNANINAKDQAISRAFQSMLEEHYYFTAVWRRWGDDAGWAVVRPVIKEFLARSGVPGFLTSTVANLVRKKTFKTLKAQGVGRHTPQEINATGIELLTALSNYLGDQPFLLGDQPRTLDATAYAFLTTLTEAPVEGPVKVYAQSTANLVAYQKRIKTLYWQTTIS
jgi:glutathione S-transferase